MAEAASSAGSSHGPDSRLDLSCCQLRAPSGSTLNLESARKRHRCGVLDSANFDHRVVGDWLEAVCPSTDGYYRVFHSHLPLDLTFKSHSSVDLVTVLATIEKHGRTFSMPITNTQLFVVEIDEATSPAASIGDGLPGTFVFSSQL